MSAPAWSNLIRFIALEDGQIYYGQPTVPGDIGLLYHSNTPIKAQLLSSTPLAPSAHLTSNYLTVGTLLSPLSPAEIRTVRGLGAQYGKPGSAKNVPAVTMLFYKPASAVVGPEVKINIPECARGMNNDYEVELCAVIGRDCKDVKIENALDNVLGYCVANDVSSRSLCAGGIQWGQGKSFDTWCPMGPSLVHPSQIPNPQALEIRTTVNGIVKQTSNTSQMNQTLAQLIVQMSQGTILEAGSIILTGSCLPLNRFADPQPFLQQGDDVRCYVEGCGTLINGVVEENGVKAIAKL